MIRFLQISDIHFTEQSGNDDENAQMKFKFLEDIEECSRIKGQIDYILICGDVAFAGTESEYKVAKDFISQICDNTKCSEDRVFMVPGNHDKKRDVYPKTREMLRESLLKGKNTKSILESKVKEPMAIGILYAPFKQYYKLAANYSCICDIARKASALPESDQAIEGACKFEPSDYMYWSESLGTLDGFSVVIHGSNSALLSDKSDGESWNLKENYHLQVLPLQAYNVEAGSDEIHILMLHHPLSEILDGEKIGKDIDNRFKLQLYGHVHKQSSSNEGAIKIYSGALQPPDSEDTKEYFPVYNVIEVDVINTDGISNLRVQVFSRKWDGTQFLEYEDESKIGDKAMMTVLQHNDSWKRIKDRCSTKEQAHDTEPKTYTHVLPHAVKYAFLQSGREGKIITEMYGDRFDKITPNRVKYLTFLKQVEIDDKMNNLNNILKRYGK